MEMTTLESPVEVWRALCSGAGLELRLKNGRPGRDSDLETELRKALSVPESAKSLDEWLVIDGKTTNPKVSVERLLIELLKGQAGFSRMMEEILETLVHAEAPGATHSLSIAFKFQGMEDPIVQTLEEFRKTVLRTQKALERRPKVPGHDTLWNIAQLLRQLSHASTSQRPRHFPATPQIPASGDPEFDRQLTHIGSLVSEVQGFWRSHGADRDQVDVAARAIPDTASGGAELKRILRAANDFWDCSVIACIQQLSCQSLSGQPVPHATREGLAEVLSHIEWGDVSVDRTVRELLDILDMPAWQRRHELYSVWVGTRLLEVARAAERSFRFNAIDGVLSFSFGGSKLATYVQQGKEYEIWAELRSALVGSSSKRKEKIQPDFRVVQAGLTEPGQRTSYVLECKHYLKSSKQNFTAAAKDYARSCPAAVVHVVNHGPADETKLLAVLPAEIQSAVRFIGEANADTQGGADSLCDAIRDVLFPTAGSAADDAGRSEIGSVAPGPAPTSCVGQIFLQWTDSLQDMDLSLLAIDSSGRTVDQINYGQIGCLTSPPFALLDADVRQGPGVERIDVSSWHFNRYELVATNFSGVGVMTPQSLECRVETPEGTTMLRCPTGLPASQCKWRIAEIFVRDGSITIQPFAPHC